MQNRKQSIQSLVIRIRNLKASLMKPEEPPENIIAILNESDKYLNEQLQELQKHRNWVDQHLKTLEGFCWNPPSGQFERERDLLFALVIYSQGIGGREGIDFLENKMNEYKHRLNSPFSLYIKELKKLETLAIKQANSSELTPIIQTYFQTMINKLK